jgi:protein-disulfide isomerase
MRKKVKKLVDKGVCLGKNVLLMATNPSKGILGRMVPVLLVLTVALAFVVGILWQKLSVLEKNLGESTQTGTGQVAAAQPTQAAVSINQIKDLFKKDLIKFGDEKRKVLFVEVTDPSCPYCHASAGKNPELNRQIDPTNNTFKLTTDGGTYLAPVPEMKKLVDEGKASLVVIYQGGHGNGELAMKALYCANEKGKYWQVSDLLYSNSGYELINNTVKNDIAQVDKLTSFLKSAIDPAELKTCLTSGKYDERLQSDAALATSLGISGTPGFYVNTTNFAGAYSFKDMESIVNTALGK